ncbi:GntR family transcriptional regulator [Draconibacterium sp.]|uniref:GntR family transcriptional regulator n=1 Tax=Draconibacterium sp. TaxID=1965318 RepID=UPI0035674823
MIIETKDLSYEVYKRLKAMILADEFKQGEKLKQEKIAQMFGVSRMPLHKAFQMLENEMLVESLPRRGFYVTTIDKAKLIDAFECREALEGVAVRRATDNVTKADLNYLRSLFEPFVGQNNVDEMKYVESDHEFHRFILKASENQILGRMEIINNIIAQTLRSGLIRGPKETLDEHLGIIKAMEKRDGIEAERLMREHSRKSCEKVKQWLKK